MHPRRLTAFILGLWLAGGVVMALIATAASWQADHLIDHPSPTFALESHAIGAPNARVLFHYQAEEEKRSNYEIWEMAQIVLGSLFFLFLLFGTEESKGAVVGGLLLLLLVLAQRFYLNPNIAAIGRELDFLPSSVPSPQRARLAVLLSFYGGVEIAKWVILVLMTARVIAARRRPELEGFRNYVNPIDKSNYRHVNR
jgi:hypothetical protein